MNFKVSGAGSPKKEMVSGCFCLQLAQQKPSARMRERVTVVTLSVCKSVCHFSILEKVPFSGLKLTSVYILGDDLSPLNVAVFFKSTLFWRKSEWNFGHNCSDLRGPTPSH